MHRAGISDYYHTTVCRIELLFAVVLKTIHHVREEGARTVAKGGRILTRLPDGNASAMLAASAVVPATQQCIDSSARKMSPADGVSNRINRKTRIWTLDMYRSYPYILDGQHQRTLQNSIATASDGAGGNSNVECRKYPS